MTEYILSTILNSSITVEIDGSIMKHVLYGFRCSEKIISYVFDKALTEIIFDSN